MVDSIQVQNLNRVYQANIGMLVNRVKPVLAVDNVSFTVGRGELFGLIGPNGAGKTTIIKILTTLLLPTAGTVCILGLDVVKQPKWIRPRIGFIFGGERGLYWRLSAIDNLRYFASLYQLDPAITKKRIHYLLDLVNLEDRGRERVEGYSRGMKQRLHIARTLLNDPEILFLDEPTIGLDPIAAREIRQTIRNLQSQQKTILLTTHHMYEADSLCQRIAVIDHGRILALDTPAALKSIVRDLSIIEFEVLGLPPETLRRLRNQSFVDTVSVENHEQKQTVLIQSSHGSSIIGNILSLLDGLTPTKVVIREPTLEDAYVRLVGERS